MAPRTSNTGKPSQPGSPGFGAAPNSVHKPKPPTPLDTQGTRPRYGRDDSKLFIEQTDPLMAPSEAVLPTCG